MSIKELLSPIHFFHFFLLSVIIYKSKTTIFSIKKETIIIISLFTKLTKLSTNNFKTDNNGIFLFVRNEQKFIISA